MVILERGESETVKGGDVVRISNWGMFLLGIYLILVGLESVGIGFELARINGIIGLVAGILIVMEHWRR